MSLNNICLVQIRILVVEGEGRKNQTCADGICNDVLQQEWG